MSSDQDPNAGEAKIPVEVVRQWEEDGTVKAELKVDEADMARVMAQLQEDPVTQKVLEANEANMVGGIVGEDGSKPEPHYSDKWEVLFWPDKRVTDVSKLEEVTVFDEDLERCAARMLALMYQNGGVGLAAPQVGYNKRVIVIDVAPGYGAPTVLCNPEVVEVSEDKDVGVEGCLSFPTLRIKISRPAAVKVLAQTMDGEAAEIEISGLLAKALQHEIDHLNGKVFTSYATGAGMVKVKSRLRKLKRYHEHMKKQKQAALAPGLKTAQNTFPPK